MKRITAVAVLLGLMSVLAAVPASATDTIGAPGVGDPYFPLDGNGGFEVDHYDLRLSYDPPIDELSGTTTILAHATQDLTQFNLDFLLHPSAVRVNGAQAEFTSQPNGELVIRPKRLVRKGRPLVVAVTYRDHPDKYTRYGEDSWRPRGGSIIIANQPHSAPWWFPSNDHPSDKATYDIAVAVPAGVEFVSTGRYLGTTPLPNGWRRWHWRSTDQQLTYTTGAVIGDFDIDVRTAPDGRQQVDAYETGILNGAAARAGHARIPEVADFLAARFGPYPFDALGGIVTVQRIGIETQGRPIIGDYYFGEGAVPPPVVVHELAHQWFGNSVSVQGWRDLWLSEGFATYAEYLWSEETGGPSAAAMARASYDRYPPEHGIWTVPLSEPPAINEPSVAGGAVFYRGAMAVHNLRATVGDESFFAILRGWTESKKDGNASTEDFKEHAESVSGRSLAAVFDTWIYAASKPTTPPDQSS